MKQEPGRRQPGIPVLQGGENVNIEAEDWKAAASLLEKASDLCWLMAERAGNAAA